MSGQNIFPYLDLWIIDFSVRLLVGSTVLEVACLVITLTFVYIISCENCGDQYVGSTTDFKTRFRIHKSDIKTMKDSVVLPNILRTNVVIEEILTYFSKHR